LGDSHLHSIYEGELVGIKLALDIARLLPSDTTKVIVCLDSQAAIKALAHPPRHQPGQHIILKILGEYEDIRTTHPNLHIHLDWVPGHQDIPGNEKADSLAKKA
ncbi:ribonuclease H-like domain-containing protein, partial [Cantharellus anzutake]|uniref:ribonuclease H-like domain-containing protein n=1 Tax=Cantharellus anzutake TaxID=1750568 RepID=UPI00190602E3